MGLYSALNASVSGMTAQSNSLSAISQNISNANTTGYKDVEAQFADLVSSASQSNFNGAGVTTNYTYLNSEQGAFATTNTSTDLAVDGNGYFVVADAGGAKYLTRDGSFSPDASGNLVNSAGYTLLGYSLAANAQGAVANGEAGLVAVNVNSSSLTATPTTTGTFSANVPSTSTVATGNLPSSNTSPVTYTEKTSVVTYDNLGTPVTLDVYMTNTGLDGSGNPTWDFAVYNKADAASGGGFPYSSGPLASDTLTFSPTTGSITGATDISSGSSVSLSSLPVTIPNGQTLNLNISGMTQLAADYTVTTATVNGSAPSGVSSVSIAANGTLSAVYANGNSVAIYSIPLANVPSQDSLVPISGNVWQVNANSGSMVLGTPGDGGLGSIKSSTLESSTVDLATQLTNMIQAQSGYEANSKVFQTASSLLSDLVNLLK